MVDRRGVPTRDAVPAKSDIEKLARRNGEYAAQGHGPSDCTRRQTHRLEITFVRGEQRGQVPARRMATDEKFVITAPIFMDVLVGPGKRPGHVPNVFGVLDVRGEAVIGTDDADAVAIECPGQNRVNAELVLVALDPAPAMNEQDHRKILMALGNMDVKQVPHGIGVGAVVVRQVAKRLLLEDRWRGPAPAAVANNRMRDNPRVILPPAVERPGFRVGTRSSGSIYYLKSLWRTAFSYGQYLRTSTQ